MSATDIVRADLLDVDERRLDAGSSRGHPRRRASGSEGAAHLRQCRDQEGAVPGRRGRPRLAAQGAADVRAQLPFPHPRSSARTAGELRGSGRRRRAGDGCDQSLAWWFTDEVLHPKPSPTGKPWPPMTMAGAARRLQGGAEGASKSSGRAPRSDRAGDARARQAAIAAGVLGEILLVIVLGVIKGGAGLISVVIGPSRACVNTR